MPIKDVFKVSRKTFFNPTGWMGFENIKESNKSLWDSMKDLFVAPTGGRSESFEEAQQRFDLDEKELSEIQKNFRFFTILFVSLAVFSLVIGGYVVIVHHTIAGFALAVAMMALFLAQAFRYHFWLFQIKHRKLGCTLQEWWSGKITQDKRS